MWSDCVSTPAAIIYSSDTTVLNSIITTHGLCTDSALGSPLCE